MNMSSRRKLRELALQLLFQEDLVHYSPEEILGNCFKDLKGSPQSYEFAEFLFRKSLENRNEIDNLIRRHAQNWRLERMSVVDRNVLRVAVSEFLYTETPRPVVIDEAIEIARRYNAEDSGEFVNGILDAIRKELELRIAKKVENEK